MACAPASRVGEIGFGRETSSRALDTTACCVRKCLSNARRRRATRRRYGRASSVVRRRRCLGRAGLLPRQRCLRRRESRRDAAETASRRSGDLTLRWIAIRQLRGRAARRGGDRCSLRRELRRLEARDELSRVDFAPLVDERLSSRPWTRGVTMTSFASITPMSTRSLCRLRTTAVTERRG